MLLCGGASPVFGKPGPPTSFDSPYVPTLQSLLAATLTQIGWFAGRLLIVVENPLTSTLYNQLPLVRPYCTLNVLTPEYGPQLTKTLVGLTLLDSIILGAIIVLARVGQNGAVGPLELLEPLEPEAEDELEAAAAQVGPLIVLAFKVTVLAASPTIRPSTVAPAFRAVVPLRAKRFPLNEVVVSRVAELPTLHQMLQASPPVTEEPGEVIIVDTDLKIQTPEPVRFRFPVRVKLLVEQ